MTTGAPAGHLGAGTDGEDGTDGTGVPPGWRALGAWALAYSVLHHLGFPLGRLGTVGADGTTRWSDWIDLLVPWGVLLPAAVALARVRAGRGTAALFLAGVILYAQGHGIHLAANSVGNAAPGPTAHLWDEVVGHWLWYAGAALVMAALLIAFAPYGAARLRLASVLALTTGVTWATNGLEGGVVPLTSGVAVAFLVAASTAGRRGAMSTDVVRLVWTAFLPALLLLAGYGLLNGGFPQPSA